MLQKNTNHKPYFCLLDRYMKFVQLQLFSSLHEALQKFSLLLSSIRGWCNSQLNPNRSCGHWNQHSDGKMHFAAAVKGLPETSRAECYQPNGIPCVVVGDRTRWVGWGRREQAEWGQGLTEV